MNIDDLTYGQIKEIMDTFDSLPTKKLNTNSPLCVGNDVYIRRPGEYHYLGKVVSVSVSDDEIVLSHASWVADGSRFSDFMTSGLSTEGIEIEPFGDGVLVSIPKMKSEVSSWKHNLPTIQIG